MGRNGGRKDSAGRLEWGLLEGTAINSDCRFPCDLIIPTPILLGTQNPQLVGSEDKVLGVVLGWNPLHGLRLATSK